MNFKLKNILWVYAFLLVIMAYIAGIFIDLTGDSGLYAAISRQMIESGNWFNLKINGQPYYEKPHLLFWLAGIGIKLFGNTNFGFKIFPALFAWLGFYFIYRLGKTIYSKEAGYLSAILAITSQIFFLYSLDIHTDSVLQTGVVLALWQLAEYLKFNKPKNFIFGFTGIGLAMLSKGPVGAVLPFFSIFLYLLVQKNFRQIFHPKWLIGIIIILCIISPALLHLYKNFGWLGIRFYFITNNFGRISGEYAGSSNDPFFYLYNSIWMFLPWTVLIFAACYKEIKSWVTDKKGDLWGVYLLGSVLTYFAIISVAKGKAPNYFLIAIPPVITVSAKWVILWKETFKKYKNLVRFNNIFLGILGLILCAVLIIYRGEKTLWFLLVLILSLTSIILAVKSHSDLFKKAIFISLILTGTFNLFLNTLVIPELASFQGARQVLKIFEKNRNENDLLYNWDLEEYELFFMADEKVENINSWERMYQIMGEHGSWLYTNETKRNEIMNLDYKIDTIYTISQMGLNQISINFLNPYTRNKTLKNNYLIRVK